MQTQLEYVSVLLVASQCWEPLPSSPRCDNNGTAGFGVVQAEQPHFFTWWKAGEDVRVWEHVADDGCMSEPREVCLSASSNWVVCSLVSKLPLPQECEALSPGYRSVKQGSCNPSCFKGRIAKTKKGDLLTVTQQASSSQNQDVSIFILSRPVCTNVTVHLHVKSCCVWVLLRPSLLWWGHEILFSVSKRARKKSTYISGSSIAN